ncbi:MAG: TROVE domain-containing protein [Thermoguttaceae bacterium]|nr:TROVE domain-containing protein [Thermoguttaceae bacterium]MDW8039467.1 TROVE domain-containing protein [Thermoguttaceae bacterium]
MANKRLFSSAKSRTPRADAINEAGGLAYQLPPKHALAQLAATGCLSNVYYTNAEIQLDVLQQLADKVDDEYLAKLAVYARQKAYMKDMPVALLVILSKRNSELFHKVFDQVVDNGRMLRNLVQMIRSGRFGRKSLSYSLQRAVQRWLNTAPVEALLAGSIGHNPSLRDVLRLARPTPPDNARRAMFGWLAESPVRKWAPATEADLPEPIRLLQAYRKAEDEATQAQLVEKLSVRWDLLAGSAKGPLVWRAIAKKMRPQALRMNLNTLVRHGVIGPNGDPELNHSIASRLADRKQIKRSRQFPYQYFAAYLYASDEVPQKIKTALCQAAEIACGNIPKLPGPVVIGLDVSGSMSSMVTGCRGPGASSKMRCVDMAALFAVALLRRNPDSIIIPFDTKAYQVKVDPDDSILSLAERLAQYGGGGTNCSLPLLVANTHYQNRRLVGCILVSDTESWVGVGREDSPAVMTEWENFRKIQRAHGIQNPKLICINLQPYTTTQASDRTDILNIAGFSDAVFEVVSAFLADDQARFVREVEAIDLDRPLQLPEEEVLA